MRTALKNLENYRMQFTGKFSRYGKKSNFKGYPEVTILLIDIRFDNSDKPAADHIWMNRTKGIQALGDLRDGDTIEFHASVREYVKGYQGYREDAALENPPSLDYKLSHPTKFRIIKRGVGDIVPVPDFKTLPDPIIPGKTKQIIKSVDGQTDLKLGTNTLLSN